MWNFLLAARKLLVGSIWDLVPLPGIEPRPTAWGAPSPNPWTTREVPSLHIFISFYPYSASLLLSLYSLGPPPQKTTCTQVYVSGSAFGGGGGRNISKVKAKLWAPPGGGEEQNPQTVGQVKARDGHAPTGPQGQLGSVEC